MGKVTGSLESPPHHLTQLYSPSRPSTTGPGVKPCVSFVSYGVRAYTELISPSHTWQCLGPAIGQIFVRPYCMQWSTVTNQILELQLSCDELQLSCDESQCLFAFPKQGSVGTGVQILGVSHTGIKLLKMLKSGGNTPEQLRVLRSYR